jgi:hypothetical protein
MPMGKLKTILPGKNGHSPQIAKAGFTESMQIYANKFSASFATAVQNIQTAILNICIFVI